MILFPYMPNLFLRLFFNPTSGYMLDYMFSHNGISLAPLVSSIISVPMLTTHLSFRCLYILGTFKGRIIPNTIDFVGHTHLKLLQLIHAIKNCTCKYALWVPYISLNPIGHPYHFV